MSEQHIPSTAGSGWSNPNEGTTVSLPYEEINHPKHYNRHPSGVECIDIVEHMNFNLGNAVKYIWRAGLKDDVETNLRKARWYIDRELHRMGVE